MDTEEKKKVFFSVENQNIIGQPSIVNRMDVWKDTQYQSTKGQFSKIPVYQSIKLNHLDIEIFPRFKSTQLHVLNMDTIDAAIDIKTKGYNPILLNMADDRNPGGMVNSGSVAQEENLFRRSNYFMTLSNHFYPLAGTACVYSPQVLYFKDNEDLHYKNLQKPISISTIAMPGIRFPGLDNSDNTIMRFKNANDKELMKKKIDMIFKCAYVFGHDSLILSALGCGAWGGPTHDIAFLFEEVAKKYNKCFRHILFAVLDKKMLEGWNKEGNYTTFRDILLTDKYSNNNQPQIQTTQPRMDGKEDDSEHIAQIEQQLFVGDMWSTRQNILEKYKIGCLISVGMMPMKNDYLNSIEHEYFQIDDYASQAEKMKTEVIPKALEIMNKAIKEGKNVCCHCDAGKSRSVTVVIAYLMKYKGLTFENAFKLVTTKRRGAMPNQGFIKILKSDN